MNSKMIERSRSSILRHVVMPGILGLCLATTSGCGDDDNGNGQHFGRVEGVVYLPSALAAALEPASGVLVRLAGGDYNQTRTSGSDGRFAFAEVPAIAMTMTMTPGECLADTQFSVTVVQDDTVRVGVTLKGDVNGDCLTLSSAGAARMEIDPSTNMAVLLYDTSTARGHLVPAIAVVNLSTGAVNTAEFNDIGNVFDIAFVTPGLVVFNCVKTVAPNGFYLRFFNISTMTQDGEDAFYTSYRGAPPAIDDRFGKLAVTPTGSDVFVSHRMRQGGTFDSKIFCVNVLQREATDADANHLDPNLGFDPDLVAGSVNWAYGLAIDEATGELLAGNYLDTLVIAIDLSFWGSFDRDLNLVAPIPGVRKINVSAGTAGFQTRFWQFAGGRGIAVTNSSGGVAPMAAYESGGTAYSVRLVQSGVEFTSPNEHLALHPSRGTWYTLVTDPSRPAAVVEAVEERSLTTLTKSNRFETRFATLPPPEPRAFAVNTQTNKLYVAYDNKPIIEIFSLEPAL